MYNPPRLEHDALQRCATSRLIPSFYMREVYITLPVKQSKKYQ